MTGAAEDLVVRFGQQAVGVLRRDGELLGFTYAQSWLDDRAAFPLSVALPLRAEPYSPAEAHTFFANLLPEGQVRIAIAQQLKLSETNDYAMLRAIGGDCAGALNIVALDDVGFEPANDYIPLPPELLATRRTAGSIFAAVVGAGVVRLSLAGAQDKLPVFVDDGALFLPVGQAASNAILKFPSSRLKYLPENETLMSRLARRLELPVCDTTLVRAGGKARSALVTRYDRISSGGRQVVRLHQEDFCQALNVPPGRKYEHEGGPTLAQAFNLVQGQSRRAARDALNLLRWAQFNLLAGNADGHAKNLSLLARPGSGLELAPFYDLVCTRIYPGIDRMAAMRIGDCADPGVVGRRDWVALAVAAGIGERLVLAELQKLLDALPDAFSETGREFEREFGKSPATTMIGKVIREQVKRSASQLADRT